jgi:polysaccharide biosynthesis transport protein
MRGWPSGRSSQGTAASPDPDLYIRWQGAILFTRVSGRLARDCGPVATVNRYVTSTDGTIVPSLLDYLRVLGRWKLVFLLILLLVPATAVAVSLNQAPTYRASAEVYLTTQTPEGSVTPPYVDPQRTAQTLADLARKSPEIVDQVLDEVPSAGLDRKEFLESSTVSTTLGSDLLAFSVENSDPNLARRLATAYAQAFTEWQQDLESDTISAEVVTPALEAPKVGPRTVRNGLIAFCLGLVLALIVVFLVDALDTRVRSVGSIREALDLPLLGRLAAPPSRLRKGNGLVMLADPTSREAEQFRALRASLDLANAEYGARTIMITSALDAEGKSTTVANLAVALARAGRRVVLIDADLSNPHLHRLFKLDQRPGLTDVELAETWLVEALRPIGLTDDSSGADDSSRRIERAGSLEVLPGGSALQDPDELRFERAVGRIIQRVRGRADVVLVDAPPLLSSNAIALSPHVDAVVVVVRLKALRTSALQDLSWILEASPATKLGFIVTGVNKSDGYGQYQRYAASERGPEARPQPTLTASLSAPDGDGEVRSQRRIETQAREGPNESASERKAEVGSDQPASGTPTEARSNSADRPFGGLSPREAAQRSAQSRRAKSAQRTEAAEPVPLDEAHDALKDA